MISMPHLHKFPDGLSRKQKLELMLVKQNTRNSNYVSSNHLSSRASSAILSDSGIFTIDTSISTLQSRLKSHFGTDITNHFQFGSSTRGTILPRSMDANSDIDYMIVFADETSKPQTYVGRLLRFAEKYYASSDIAQSHPTVALKLNHIKFDLVPAIKSYVEEYRIPAPTSSYQEWMATAPNDFNSALAAANNRCSYNLKPATRLLKYWNALAGYVFDSYFLEKWSASRYFSNCSTSERSLLCAGHGFIAGMERSTVAEG